jgi:hypothetical protein
MPAFLHFLAVVAAVVADDGGLYGSLLEDGLDHHEIFRSHEQDLDCFD